MTIIVWHAEGEHGVYDIMNIILENALKLLTSSVNTSIGLSHPNDLNRAKDLFVILHEHDIELRCSEISLWASNNGWNTKDARQLGILAQNIGEGKRVMIRNRGGWWKNDIFMRLKEDLNKEYN